LRFQGHRGCSFRFQYPGEGPLKPADFSGGEATVAPKLQSLGFEVVRLGEDWSQLDKALVLCKVEIKGQEIEYGGGKWAASQLRVIEELGEVAITVD
jgi:hypothetical protein